MDSEVVAHVPATQETTSTPNMKPLAPLPNCEGPKLGPFTQNFEDLKFEPELVIKSEWEHCHGLVIKAKLDGKTYGIKFFHQRDGLFNPEHYYGLSEGEIALAKIQSDAFFSECRAYGRLKEENAEHLAVKAYGYVQLFINERTEEMFKPAVKMWTREREFGSLAEMMKPYTEGLGISPGGVAARPSDVPIYGIVKDWAGGDVEHDMVYRDNEERSETLEREQRAIDSFPRQLEDLHELHRLGIVVRNYHPRQYVEGKLVDLSSSWTVPHVLGQGDRDRPDWSFASYAARDLFQLQYCIDVENHCLRNTVACMRVLGDPVPPFRMSNVVAYPRTDSAFRVKGLEETPAARREGLRPLPHRLAPLPRDWRVRRKNGNRKELPLLLYTERYDSSGASGSAALIPWTHGPRWDPARFVPGKQRGDEESHGDVLGGYIDSVMAAARRDRLIKREVMSKIKGRGSTKGGKVTKRRRKGAKMAKRS